MENGTADQSLFQFNTSTLQWSKVRNEYGLNRFLCYPIHFDQATFHLSWIKLNTCRSYLTTASLN